MADYDLSHIVQIATGINYPSLAALLLHSHLFCFLGAAHLSALFCTQLLDGYDALVQEKCSQPCLELDDPLTADAVHMQMGGRNSTVGLIHMTLLPWAFLLLWQFWLAVLDLRL